MPSSSTETRALGDRIFAPLSGLMRARKGILPYFGPLLESADDIIRLGAVCQMLSLRTLPPKHIELVIGLCSYGAVKRRAFDYFQGELHLDLAGQVANTKTASLDDALSRLMKAQLAVDEDRQLEASIGVYYETGDMKDLVAIAVAADNARGWKQAAEWLARAAALTPVDPTHFLHLFHTLADANQFDLVDELCALLSRAGLHPYLYGIYAANSLLARGDAAACIRKIGQLTPPGESAPQSLRSAAVHAKRLLADAHDRLGKYEISYRFYAEMNRADQSPTVIAMSETPALSSGTTGRDLATVVPPLPTKTRDDIVMLLSFPRSGTTLLDNVLDAHPDLEAFDEPPTWNAALAAIRLQWRQTLSGSERERTEGFSHARDVYFNEVDKRRKKPGARFVVDKDPMRSGQAGLVKKLLPSQKYVFAIRHPFDVVLSCFRQRFNANVATESFRTLKGAIDVYDSTMTKWFEHHKVTDPFVHYVKYDALVSDFDQTVGGVLTFIGVPWNDSVHDFAEAAQDRIAKTPSYQKVRQGLSIGVQTYWRNYKFVFDSPDAKPLHKWAEFFGYPTS